MALSNGQEFYGFTAAEIELLEADGNYTTLLNLLRSDGITETIGSGNDAVTYTFLPKSLLDPVSWNAILEDDPTPPNVTLDFAVYYSAFGFRLY